MEDTDVRKIGVAIVDSPSLQAGILRDIVEESEDLELVLESPLPLERVPEAVVRSVDVLLVGADAIEPSTMRYLLETHPTLKTVAIGSSARDGRLYELAPSMVLLRPVTPASLVGAIRDALSRGFDDGAGPWVTTVSTAAIEERE